jgi:hypothetical protein
MSYIVLLQIICGSFVSPSREGERDRKLFKFMLYKRRLKRKLLREIFYGAKSGSDKVLLYASFYFSSSMQS